MRDFMKDRIAHFRFRIQLHKVPRKRNFFLRVVTFAEPNFGMIELKRPDGRHFMQPHQVVSELASFCKCHDVNNVIVLLKLWG